MAHVDAGKTTLSEGLLYTAGKIREMGRVDHGDAFLDTHALEKKRGITIFLKQAVMPWGILMDTPGHVDFAPEMERVLRVLDYAILVVSGTDGIQGHTRTLWRLLEKYELPVFIFVNKMDQPDVDKETLLHELQGTFGDGVIDFTGAPDSIRSRETASGSEARTDEGVETDSAYEVWAEAIAMTDEALMEEYLESGEIDVEAVREGITRRRIVPCFFGSALKLEGVDSFYEGLSLYTEALWEDSDPNESGARDNAKLNGQFGIGGSNEDFGAIVYKISRDEKGTRLTHVRVTGGTLRPKQAIDICPNVASGSGSMTGMSSAGDHDVDGVISEKVDQIRLYNGTSYELMEEALPGDICALTGLKETYPGQGIGTEEDLEQPILKPVLNYRLILPEDVAVGTFLPKLTELGEEMPELMISCDTESSIHIRVMGEVQTEILRDVIEERYGVMVSFGEAEIVYKETVTKSVEGIGHYEPLKHYAEAHIAIEPGEPGSGIVVGSAVREDDLDLNWQRLIITHLLEKEHRGVKTGAGLTDVKLTVVGGKAHLKHTEGGDFRQATYRAIRMGLMQAECRVLEPYYDFTLIVPTEQVGRAMTDIERMCGTFTMEDAQDHLFMSQSGNSASGNTDSTTFLTGLAPVVTMQNYARELSSYTGGMGELTLSFHGYLPCHNEDEVIEACGYDPETDEENPPGSVFCAHGAGYYVPWNEVADMAHIQTGWKPGTVEKQRELTEEEMTEQARLREMDLALGVEEIDQIIERVGNANRRSRSKAKRRVMGKRVRQAKAPQGPSKPRKTQEKIGDYLLVDGYNVIHASEELRELAKDDMEQARGRLMDLLCNYQGYRGGDVILVFDAYRVASHPTEAFDYHNIHVVFTKTAETADQYIERFSVEKAERYHVTVATSDGLEQVIIRGAGAHLMSARELVEVL